MMDPKNHEKTVDTGYKKYPRYSNISFLIVVTDIIAIDAAVFHFNIVVGNRGGLDSGQQRVRSI